MGDFFIFRSDMHPFPGGAGIELTSIWIWRSLMCIACCLAVISCVDRLTERVRQVGKGAIRRLAPAMVCAICIPVVVFGFWFFYVGAPNSEFIVQLNRMLSVPEIGFISLLLLVAAWGVHQKCLRPRWKFSRLAVWVLAFALVLVVVSTLWWRVIVYRGAWVSFAELSASLVLFVFLLARFYRVVWRWRSWKSTFPMVAWSLALVCVVLGWIAWFGLGEMVLTACA